VAATDRVVQSPRVDRSDDRRDRSAADSGAGTRTIPSLGFVCGIVVVFACAMVGTAQLHDNSFFTHLATGRLLIDEGVGQLWGGMPDPYTFTSGGREWVVQSWFASVLYAAAEDVAGAAGIRLLTAATCAAVGGLAWRLMRPADSLIPRVLLAGGVILVGASTWTSRPFMFGLLCLALTLLAAEGGLDPRWLVPVGWLWVNTHGSFPLGVLAVVLLAAGRWLDGTRPDVELRALRWSLVGIVFGGLVNPVGPKLLFFPVTMVARSEALSTIIEWQSPSFDSTWARVFLGVVLLGVISIARRPSYRAALPFAVFLALALVAQRNVTVAMLVFLPGLSVAMAGLGSIEASARRPAFRLPALALGALAPVLVVASCLPGDFDLRGYPTAALDELDRRGMLEGGARVATQDYVGNLLSLSGGREASTFIDDRYELHDEVLVDDYGILFEGRPEWREVLDRWDIDAVVWERDAPLGSLLLESDEWRVIYDDTTAPVPDDFTAEEWEQAVDAKAFVVACRTDFAPCDEDR